MLEAQHPRHCLEAGTAVTSCGDGLIARLKSTSGAEFEAFRACLADTNNAFDKCRAQKEALHAAFERGTLRREDVFVTSKLWNDRRKPEDVRAGLRQTLEDLRLEYLDMYLIHWPVVWKRGTLMQDDPDASLAECWEALERAMDEGLVRGVGVSNFSERQLAELIRVARVKPAVNQIEIHPRLPQTELVRYCQSQGVQVTAYSPLARGGGLLDHPAVVRVATRLGVTPAQAALRWNVQNGVVVIPKSVTPARIAQNADIFGFELGAAPRVQIR